MAPSLFLHCLGTPVLATPSGEQVRLRTRKHLALLVRLAVEPDRKFTRDYLTDLLWPGAPARLASHSLAQGLSVLRGKVGREPVLVQRAHVALAAGAVDADVHHLDGCDLDVRGHFLDGFDIPDARPFEDWKDEWRARLLPRVRDCLVRQMEAGRRTGDFATVERHADVLRDLDPLSEDAVRGLIEARAWVGDRTTALKVFSAYEARLADELQARPSPELVRMASLLREGRRSAPPRGVAEPLQRAEKRFEAETLIGREREFSVLYDAWLGARRRTPAIVVVTGDPGLGKTTLANAFVSTCQLEGAVVARAQAYDAERELPFAVLAELVRQLAIQRAIGCADPEALSELSRLTPEVTAQFPGVPKPAEWAAEIVPLRLADAFLKTVTAAAEENPVVLVVDDIHAADNASTAILHIVARKLPATRLMLILAARPTELRASGAPAALTSDATLETLRSLDLEPLPDEAATGLVERVRAASGGDAELPRERILRAGRGNPLALELLTREWVAHGPESLLRDLEAVNTQPAAAIGIPRAIKVVFERQVARLDAKTRAVLDLAAVLGRRLADLSLYQAVDCTPAEAAEALGRLRDEGFVREVHGDIEFRNELIRAQAYYAVPGPGRQHLHRRIAENLAQVSESSSDPSPLEIAWHLLRGGSLRQAIEEVLRGAEGALSVGAPFEAEQILGIALSEDWDPELASRLRVMMARALLDQSKAEQAMPILAILEGYLAALTPREKAQVLRMQASGEYLTNKYGTPRHTLAAERAVQAAREAHDQQLVIQALFEYARSGVESGDAETMRAARDEIGQMIERNEPPLPMAYITYAFCSYYLAFNPRVGADCLKKAIALLNGTHSLRELSLAYNGLGVCLQELFHLEGAEEAFLKAYELAHRIGDDSRCSIISANLCTLRSFQGRFEEAIELGRRSVRLGKRAMNQPLLMQSHLNLAETYLLAGLPERAREYRAEARKQMAQERRWRGWVEFHCENASLALLEGNVPEALACVKDAEQAAGVRGGGLTPLIGFHKWRAFRMAHMRGFGEALRLARDACDRFRDRSPLGYFDSLALLNWIEREHFGSVSPATTSALAMFDPACTRGRRFLLTAQGFLQ